MNFTYCIALNFSRISYRCLLVLRLWQLFTSVITHAHWPEQQKKERDRTGKKIIESEVQANRLPATHVQPYAAGVQTFRFQSICYRHASHKPEGSFRDALVYSDLLRS